MAHFISPIDFDGSLSEWRDHFRRKSFTLARATMMDAYEYYPRRPEALFLLGLTELAARDVKNAEDHFNDLAEMLESGDFERAEFFRKHEKALRGLTPWILQGLENRSLYAAPYDPWMWLENWEEVVRMRPNQARSFSFQPLGRTQPLLGSGAGVGEMRPIPRLMDQLKVEPVRVDTMKSLLGRDADLAIERHRIRIMDNTVSIEKPLLLAADGTYQQLKTVDVQRPRWDANYAPPPSTISDLAPAVQLPPLPKMEPLNIAPVLALAPVVFEMPILPQMQSLSTANLPGATPVGVTSIIIERPPIPEAPEIQGLNRASDQVRPPIKIDAPPPPAPPPAPSVEPKKPSSERPPAIAPAATPLFQPTPQRVSPPGKKSQSAGREDRKKHVVHLEELTPSIEKDDFARGSVAAPAVLAAGGAAAATAATVSAPPSPWDKWEQEVEALADRGALTEALRRASEAVEKYPQSARLEEFFGSMLERSGRVEDAAKSYVAAYKKARESGATDRAQRVLEKASAIARRSGPLMLEVGSLLAAIGATGVAAALLVGAADHFRRSGDRRRLVQILDLLRKVSGTNPSAVEEVRRLEGEVGSVVRSSRALVPEIRSVIDAPERSSPPSRPPVAPRVSARVGGPPDRSKRALSANIDQAADRGDAKGATGEMGGGTLLGISFFVLFFTALTGWTLPSVVGGIFAALKVMEVQENSIPAVGRVLPVVSLIVFGLAFLISLFR